MQTLHQKAEAYNRLQLLRKMRRSRFVNPLHVDYLDMLIAETERTLNVVI